MGEKVNRIWSNRQILEHITMVDRVALLYGFSFLPPKEEAVIPLDEYELPRIKLRQLLRERYHLSGYKIQRLHERILPSTSNIGILQHYLN